MHLHGATEEQAKGLIGTHIRHGNDSDPLRNSIVVSEFYAAGYKELE